MNDSFLERAQLLLAHGKPEMAEGVLRSSLAENPQHARAHAFLALALVEQKKYEEASAEAALAVHNAPDDPFVHYITGHVFFDRNRFPESEAAAREAIRLSGGTGHPEYWSLLAHALFARERWSEALAAADQGLAIDPAHADSVNVRAMALVKLGDKQAAAQTISGALQRNPTNPASHANQGWTLLHQGDHKQALEHFREALRLNPNLEWARQGMIEALKARYFLYRIMLRYYLWMSRFTRRGQWGLIIGLWVGIQILQAVREKNPAAAPFVLPVIIAYVAFVLAGWLASPIFNLTLLASFYGRYLLSKTDYAGALAVGALVAGAIVAALLGLFEHSDMAIVCALFMALLSLAAASAARTRAMPASAIMWSYAAVLAVTGTAGLLLVAQDNPIGDNLLLPALWGSVLSGLVANIIATTIRKH